MRIIAGKHPKIERALKRYGQDKFIQDAEAILSDHPRIKVVLGLLGGPSTGRFSYRATAGKNYPRFAVRYERGIGIVGIAKHSGPYYYITL